MSDIIQDVSLCHLSFIFFSPLGLMFLFLSATALLAFCFFHESFYLLRNNLSTLYPQSCVFPSLVTEKHCIPLVSDLVQEHLPKRQKDTICIKQWLGAASEEQDCEEPQRGTPQEQVLVSKLKIYAPVLSSLTHHLAVRTYKRDCWKRMPGYFHSTDLLEGNLTLATDIFFSAFLQSLA